METQPEYKVLQRAPNDTLGGRLEWEMNEAVNEGFTLVSFAGDTAIMMKMVDV